jgi:hypothetical protein
MLPPLRSQPLRSADSSAARFGARERWTLEERRNDARCEFPTPSREAAAGCPRRHAWAGAGAGSSLGRRGLEQEKVVGEGRRSPCLNVAPEERLGIAGEVDYQSLSLAAFAYILNCVGQLPQTYLATVGGFGNKLRRLRFRRWWHPTLALLLFPCCQYI